MEKISIVRRYRLSEAFLKYLFFLLLIFFSPYASDAADLDLEKDLQQNIEQSRTVVEKISKKIKSGSPTDALIERLKSLSENIKASHLLMQERFKLREEKVKALGSKAIERQRVMSEGYSKALTEYLSLIEGLPSASSQESGDRIQKKVEKIKSLIDKIIPKKKRPIFGSLPYKHLNYPAKEPSTAPAITPAYRGGNQNSTSDDLKSTAEAPISNELATLAQSLNWNPVSIYEYVKNNIETEWYWGCMKGAEETLHQKSGNDCDQAALLLALLRASGYPTRYVRGSIEFFPDIEKAKNLTGVTNAAKLGDFFQKAGIPFKTVLDGTTIKNIQIEHIWVESLIPYSNYRGALADAQGKIWLGLDTSIKAAGYTYNTPSDILSEYSLATIRDDYLSATQTQTPLEYIKTKINDYLAQNHPGKTYADYLSTKTLTPEVMKILPASMQFNQVKVTHEYIDVPDELKHKVKFTATDPANAELFTITFDALKLSNKKIIMSYEPDTVDDQEIINSFGGLDNTPAYLVHLRPTLLIDDEQIITASGGVAMGGDYNLTVTVTSPYGAETFTNTMISGNMTAIGIVSQRAVVPATIDQTKAANLLYREALRYIDNWNKGEEELASLLQVAAIRPIPSAVTLGNTIDVTYLLDQPNGFEWKGVYLDADLRTIEALPRTQTPGDRTLIFMQLSGLHGSVLENKIFEDAFQVGSVSTAKLFGLANSGLPATPILAIDQTNIDTVLPTLPFDQNIKDDITDAVNNQSLTVRIPQSEIVFEDWTGIGYIKENATTGEAGYMLSGMVAGGMTAWGFDRWPAYYAERLINPFSEPPNYDPNSATFIQKVTGTDMQEGTVGLKLPTPLQVKVMDMAWKPVKGVSVTFTVKAGGGSLSGKTAGGQQVTGQTITVPTDAQGIASASITLGQKTSDNPGYFKKTEADKYAYQMGENIVDASLSSGTTITTPFTAYGLPDAASQMNLWGNSGSGDILSYYGSIGVFIKDQYGNPIANLPVDFKAETPTPTSTDPQCAVPDALAALLTKDTVCINARASRYECPGAKSSLNGITDQVITLTDGGVYVDVIMGNLPYGKYPITATNVDMQTGKTLTGAFTLNTYSFGNCSIANAAPSNHLFVKYFYEADENGASIEARKAGAAVPLRVKTYWLHEGEKAGNVNTGCSPSLMCSAYIGDRVFSIIQPDQRNVSFNGIAGASVGSDMFEAAVPLIVGTNNITISSSAAKSNDSTVSLHVLKNLCNDCSLDTSLTMTGSKTAQVVGVDFQMPAKIYILIDENGYLVQDKAITYSILPNTYTAATAQFFIYKNNKLAAVMQTLTQGSPTATIARGFWFDKTSTYEAQVVLNYGYKSEIWSDRKTLTVTDTWARITDVDTPCDNLVIQNPCVDSFVALRPVNNVRPGESVTATAEAKNGAIDISDQITWTCTGDDTDSGACTISTDSPGSTMTFIPNPPPADTGRTKPLAYQVKAQITVEGQTYEDTKTIKQDDLDQLRQEYQDMNKDIKPERSQFVNAQIYQNPLGHFPYDSIKSNGDINTWAIFTIEENLENVRVQIGNQDMIVNSGYRTPIKQLQESPQYPNGRHMYGDAADIKVKDFNGDLIVDENDWIFLRNAAKAKNACVEPVSVSGTYSYVHMDWRGECPQDW